MANVVGERYQITIDREIRRALGIKPGDRAVERVEDGRLVVDFIPAPHRESQHGIFKRPGQPVTTDWEDMRDRVWAMRTSEIRETLERDSDRHRRDD